jgi:acetyl-CoA synthetase
MTAEGRVKELLDRYDAPDACVATLLCDAHPADSVAFTVVEPDLSSQDVTYGTLRDQSERFAAGLAALSIGPGDAVGVLMGKSVELVVTLLGIWRRGAVPVPLFTAFAPPAIALRLHGSSAKAVVVDTDQREKLDLSDALPAPLPWRVVTVGDGGGDGDLSFNELLARDSAATGPPVAVGGDAPFIMIFTSGTTGAPKGVPTLVRGIAHMVMYMEYGYDLRPDDVYWNAADPGWAYGLFYVIVGPMAIGRRSILVRGGFSPGLAWTVLSRLEVTNLAAAPTAYRAMRNAPPSEQIALRCASSAGEPLTPDLIPWAEQALEVPIADHYGQTELGMVVANAWHPDIRRPIKPGSMGYPLPGHNVEVLLEDADEVAPAGVQGRLAIDTEAPLYAFPGYHADPERSTQCLTGDGRWYITGDSATRDSEGAFLFSSRDDDVIIMAGYRIGPFEIESVLVQHRDVAEAAVVGVPDALRGEVVEAFVVLRPGVIASEELTSELQQLVRKRFAAHAYPRSVHYIEALPKTPSGKIQRFVLREARHSEGHAS